MKLRTIGQLEDAIDEEVAWRKFELARARLAVDRAKGGDLAYFIRSGIALTYAHWEGWIKNISQLYLDYVNQQRLSYLDMAPAILGGALKSKIAGLDAANSASIHLEFARFLIDELSEQGTLSSSSLIRTESNLSSKVLADILIRIGLDGDLFAVNSHFIDENLVSRRNEIAHGKWLDMKPEEFAELSKKVQDMLDEFTDRVRNLAELEAYRRV